jgi:hypothetical protein
MAALGRGAGRQRGQEGSRRCWRWAAHIYVDLLSAWQRETLEKYGAIAYHGRVVGQLGVREVPQNGHEHDVVHPLVVKGLSQLPLRAHLHLHMCHHVYT